LQLAATLLAHASEQLPAAASLDEHAIEKGTSAKVTNATIVCAMFACIVIRSPASR